MSLRQRVSLRRLLLASCPKTFGPIFLSTSPRRCPLAKGGVAHCPPSPLEPSSSSKSPVVADLDIAPATRLPCQVVQASPKSGDEFSPQPFFFSRFAVCGSAKNDVGLTDDDLTSYTAWEVG